MYPPLLTPSAAFTVARAAVTPVCTGHRHPHLSACFCPSPCHLFSARQPGSCGCLKPPHGFLLASRPSSVGPWTTHAIPASPPIHTGLLAMPPNMPAVLSGEGATPAVCPLCLKTLSPELGVARLLEIFAGLLAGRCGLPCAPASRLRFPPQTALAAHSFLPLPPLSARLSGRTGASFLTCLTRCCSPNFKTVST